MGQGLLSVVLTGLIIGFSVAAPVGPMGVLCIRRTLADGRVVGFVSGLGAATADAAYGCVAAFGLTWVSDLLVDQLLWLRLVGGVFLLYQKPSDGVARDEGSAGTHRTPD